MSDFSRIVQLISIWGICIPLLVGLISYKTTGFQFRLFILFLFIGFLTDIVMYILQQTTDSNQLGSILNVYSLVEAMVFFWMVKYSTQSSLISRIARIFLIITPFAWVALLWGSYPWFQLYPSQVFDPFYEISMAFLAGFILLQQVERQPDVIHMPIFWIMLGIFFYCFCTFFIMGFLNTLLAHRIWFMNNIINILTYMIYTVGLWKLRQPTTATISR